MKKKQLSFVVGLTGNLYLATWGQPAVGEGIVHLEEIVITAQKREQGLQEVPIAVSVLSANFIEENDVRTLEDLAASIPGLIVTNPQTGGQAPLSIRGLGGPSGGGTAFNDDPVGIYVNEMYIARSGISVQDLVDVESIQVLRGPQGTLYGRNTTAGGVLITTKKPTKSFESELRAGYGAYTVGNEYNVSGVVSGPLSEKLLARTAFGYRDNEGYAKNIVNGDKMGGSESGTARLSLEYRASERLTANLVASYANQETDNATLSQAALTTLPGPFLTPVYGGNPFVQRPDFDEAMEDNEVAYEDPNFTDIESKDAVLSLHWDFDSLVFDSITGFRTQQIDSAQDSDAQPNATTYKASDTALSLVNNISDSGADQFTQEFRLSSASDSSFQWIAGVFFIHEDIDFDINIFNDQGGPPVPAIPPFTGFAGTNSTFVTSQEVDAYAAFFDASYQFTDKLKLTLGGRYSYETKDVDIAQSVTRADNGAVLAAFDFIDDDSFNDFSPRVVVDYAPTTNTLLYGSFSKGFKSGGFNSFDASPAAASYPEENIDAYELGLKSDLLDKRLRVNMAAFYYDYTNLQLRQAVFTGGVSIRTVEEAEVKGFELETTWVPDDHWMFRANAAYLDGELKKGVLNALPSDIGVIQVSAQQFPPPADFPTEDIAGNRMTRSPEWQFYFYGEYEFHVIDGVFTRLGVTYKYQDEIFFTETNQDAETFRGESWDEVDVRFSLGDDNGRWELALFGQNIFDDRHVTQTAPFSGFPVSSLNEPAKWGIQGVWRFQD